MDRCDDRQHRFDPLDGSSKPENVRTVGVDKITTRTGSSEERRSYKNGSRDQFRQDTDKNTTSIIESEKKVRTIQ